MNTQTHTHTHITHPEKVDSYLNYDEFERHNNFGPFGVWQAPSLTFNSFWLIVMLFTVQTHRHTHTLLTHCTPYRLVL